MPNEIKTFIYLHAYILYVAVDAAQEANEMETQEQKCVASVVNVPYPLKGRAVKDRPITVLAESGGRIKLAFPDSEQEMNFFMNLTGFYRAAYNSTDDGPIKANAKGDILDGPAEQRRAFLRALIYQRTKEKPREFTYMLDEHGRKIIRGVRVP